MPEPSKYDLTCMSPHSKFKSITDICLFVPEIGDIIEIGVWRGGTALHFLELFPQRKIFLADTFTGFPYVSPQDNHYGVGGFSNVNVEDVRKRFSPFPNVTVLQGIFPDAFCELLDKEAFVVAHVDVDIYKSYADTLEFIYPRMVKDGIVLLDDYKCPVCAGATLAVDEFLANHDEKVQVHEGEYFFVKL